MTSYVILCCSLVICVFCLTSILYENYKLIKSNQNNILSRKSPTERTYMYKKNSINLYFRKPCNTVTSMEVEVKEPSPYTIVRNFENIQKQWEEDWQKECAKFGHPTRSKPDRVTASFFPPLLKPVPEHFQVLISKDTARNKASQTHSTYNAYWPEAYMDPTDFLITPKQSTVNTLSELTTIQNNEKETKTSITYNKHKQTIYHCRTCPLFEFVFDLRDTNKYLCSSTQLDFSVDEETKTAESTDGRDGSISLEEETTRMACYWVL